LSRFYGTDKIAFTTTDDDVPGAVRSFSSFSSAAAEAGMSRIYGGIHFQFDNTAALVCGRHVGEWVADHVLTDSRGRNGHDGGNHGPGRGDDRDDDHGDRGHGNGGPAIGQVIRDVLTGVLNHGSIFGGGRRILA
jgi:hypothetical protein